MKSKKKSRNLKIVIVAVIILLIFLHFINVINPVENYIFSSLFSFQGNTYSFFSKLKYSFINFQEAQKLKQENQQLKAEINDLLVENVKWHNFELENNKLREILNFKNETNQELVLVKVIGKDLNKDNTLIINQGKASGLGVGMPVIVGNGIIIGKIIKVNENNAVVLLLTDTQSKVAISVPSSNKTAGLAQGEFGLSIKVEYIPQDLEINENDLIITSGLESLIPRGLVLGKINRILSQENDLFKTVSINPLVDYTELVILAVINNQNIEND